MYSAQTSLIPVTVALVRYIKDFGIFGNYPFWYLGTTPVKYLIGPIVPLIEIVINRFTSLNFFDISIYLVILSHLFSVFGWSFFVFKISKDKKLSLISLIFFVLFPWRIFSSLAIQETSFVLARNTIPFVLIFTYSCFKKGDVLRFLEALILHCFVLLLHTGIIPILFVLEASLALSISYKKYKFVNISKYIKNILVLLFLSMFAVTFWYGFKYWITILFNPSLGGLSVIKVLARIFELLRWFIPVILAVLVTRIFQKEKDRLKIFVFLFLSFFGILTFYRFISDWDFWMDWSTWFFEIEVGLAILISTFLTSIKKVNFSKVLFFALTFSFPFLTTFTVFSKMEKPKIISDKLPNYVKTLNFLNNISNDDLIFLSGSSVFWVNSFYDIYQIRGGRDEVAIDSNWNKLSYDLRESQDIDTIATWISRYKIKYVLIHLPQSDEYFQDFKNQNLWSNVGKLILNEDGNQIYQVYTRKISE